MMKDLFKQIFAKYNLSDKQLDELLNNFCSVLVMSIVANAKDLDDQSVLKIHQLWDENRFQDVLEIVRSRYSPEEWQEYTYQQTAPLFEDYLVKLLKNKNP